MSKGIIRLIRIRQIMIISLLKRTEIHIQGEKAKDYSKEAYRYGQGRRIQTGPKGGQYYVNDKGRKVYVPKRKNSL